MRCYDKKDDEANLHSYRDDILDIAYHSRKEGKLLRIDFDESLISEYDKDMTRGTFYPITLDGNVSPWNNMNVIVESTPELWTRGSIGKSGRSCRKNQERSFNQNFA